MKCRYGAILLTLLVLLVWGCGGDKSASPPINHAPEIPSNPFPINNAANIGSSITLSWQCSDPDNNPITYDVYLGTQPTPALAVSGITNRSHTVSGLQSNATYYWRILAADSAGETASGPIWRFTTAISDTGRIVFISNRNGNEDIFLMNADGTHVRGLTNHSADDVFPAWSPDGSQIAFASWRDGNGEIYIMNADGTDQHNITNRPEYDNCPSWAPDGAKIIFNSGAQGYSDGIYMMNSDGSGRVKISDAGRYPRWSPDGSKIVYVTETSGNYLQIFVMNADGSNPHNISNSGVTDEYPAWSPDGLKIAFRSDRTGEDDSEIWVMNTDGSHRVNVSNHDGDDNLAYWSSGGARICFVSYLSGNGQIYVMNADGSDLHDISDNGYEDLYPVWSPL